MDRREEIIVLCGQIVNGIMASDDSVMSKVLDRCLHDAVASATVSLAVRIQDLVDERIDEK